jgi:hypothetical protein
MGLLEIPGHAGTLASRRAHVQLCSWLVEVIEASAQCEKPLHMRWGFVLKTGGFFMFYTFANLRWKFEGSGRKFLG